MKLTESELLEKLNNGIDEVIENNYSKYDRAEKIKERLSECKNICCFGIGKFFEDCVKIAGFNEFDILCDNDEKKWGKYYFGKRCVSVKELQEINDLVVIVTVSNYKDIFEQLKRMNIETYYIGDYFLNTYDKKYTKQYFEKNKEKIIEAYSLFDDYESKEVYVEHFLNKVTMNQYGREFYELQTPGEYFDTGLLDITDEEYFVDCGAFDGDTICEFVKKCKNNYKKIYAFELDNSVYKELIENITKMNMQNVNLYNVGVDEEEKEIRYAYKGNSYFSAKTMRLDDVLENEKVTFIKMDIEGAELGALKGAEKIIKKQSPKLAVCLYHLLSDLWEIPILIKKMNRNYKINLRHHSPIVWDTVLYAQI